MSGLAERGEHLEEAVRVLRLLLAGGPADFAGRHYQLEAAHAFPAPTPAPRIVVAGTTAVGARLAARDGDAWTCFADGFDELLPVFDAALGEAGRVRADVPILVGIEIETVGDSLDELSARWQERGAAELIVHDVGPHQLDRMLELGGS